MNEELTRPAPDTREVDEIEELEIEPDLSGTSWKPPPKRSWKGVVLGVLAVGVLGAVGYDDLVQRGKIGAAIANAQSAHSELDEQRAKAASLTAKAETLEKERSATQKQAAD